MKTITEAILSKKGIQDIANVEEELFKRSFRNIYLQGAKFEYISNPKKYDYAIIRLGSLIATQYPKDIELNSYIINIEEWESNGLNKEIAFTSYTGDKRLETKYPITIVFEGDYIEGFTFIGSNINFIIGSHQRVKDCDFSEVGEAKFYFYDESAKNNVSQGPTYNTVCVRGAFVATEMVDGELKVDRTSELHKIFDVRSNILPDNKTFYLGAKKEGASAYQSINPDIQAVMDTLNCKQFDIKFRYLS